MATADEKTGMLDVVLRIGERLGVPLLLMAALLYMVREAGIAVYGGAVKPLVQAHSAFLESTQGTLREIGQTQRQQAEAMQELVIGQREITVIINDDKGRN